ncbi:IS110 family transposase [Marinifilum flexuosum]|uniref:IS110 family transposase n=1 Tax=Marinifilum flexuosum TaxID=1117708 RepID=UPI00248FB699|nr:IS110 family transposase [Marinifilum flexuosum]
MKNTVIVGIDFSKKTIDVTYFIMGAMQEFWYKQFANTEQGCKDMISWIKKNHSQTSEWLICGEYTGIYSMTAATVFNDNGLDLWLENPNQIKLSSGMSREKNDKVDSYHIALYAARFMDRIKLYKPQSKTLLQVRELIRFKDRLTKVKTQLSVAAGELKSVRKDWQETEYICKSSKSLVDQINSQIADVENKMIKLLKTDPELKQMYKLINSVVGVGIQTTIYLLIHTWGFRAFENPRQLACYCGTAPFSKHSGTSLKGKPHVSHIANKKLKTLLHMCALNVVRHDPYLKLYYQRKIEEGKHKMNVLNNVRNKLIHRICAVITSGQEYDKNYYIQNTMAAA